MTMNVNLSPQLDEWVRKKVASGMYASASEVIRAALRVMKEQERLKELQLTHLREQIRDGLESGPSEPWDLEEIKKTARENRQKRKRES